MGREVRSKGGFWKEGGNEGRQEMIRRNGSIDAAVAAAHYLSKL